MHVQHACVKWGIWDHPSILHEVPVNPYACDMHVTGTFWMRISVAVKRFQNRKGASPRRGDSTTHTMISCSKPASAVHTHMDQSCSTGSLAVEVLQTLAKHRMNGGKFGQVCDVAVRKRVMQMWCACV